MKKKPYFADYLVVNKGMASILLTISSLHSYFGKLYLFNIFKLAAHRSCNGAEKMRKPKQMDSRADYLFNVTKY